MTNKAKNLMQFKVYNEENKEVANNLDTVLELLELNGYKIIQKMTEEEEYKNAGFVKGTK